MKFNKLYAPFLVALLKFCIGGLIIGLLHYYPKVLALILFGFVLRRYTKDTNNPAFSEIKVKIILGIVLSFCLGAFSEWLGTENSWWIYQFYGKATIKVPVWVPFAWVIVYQIFFGLEEKWLSTLDNKAKWLSILSIFLILPSVGEIIAMHFGTWHYTFEPQFLLMPAQALILIACVHLLLYFLVSKLTPEVST